MKWMLLFIITKRNDFIKWPQRPAEPSHTLPGMVRNDSGNGTEGFQEWYGMILFARQEASCGAFFPFTPCCGMILKNSHDCVMQPSPRQALVTRPDSGVCRP